MGLMTANVQATLLYEEFAFHWNIQRGNLSNAGQQSTSGSVAFRVVFRGNTVPE